MKMPGDRCQPGQEAAHMALPFSANYRSVSADRSADRCVQRVDVSAVCDAAVCERLMTPRGRGLMGCGVGTLVMLQGFAPFAAGKHFCSFNYVLKNVSQVFTFKVILDVIQFHATPMQNCFYSHLVICVALVECNLISTSESEGKELQILNDLISNRILIEFKFKSIQIYCSTVIEC